MTDAANMQAVIAAGVDALGFIFHPRSPRHCHLSPAEVRAVPDRIRTVCVTVDMPQRELEKLLDAYGFDTLQLHGSESPATCRMWRRRGLKVWKAVQAANPDALAALQPYEGCVDAFLLDTPTPAHGGSGRKFDWSLLDSYTPGVPFILSGGIAPTDWHLLNLLDHPRLAGVDLNSRFETSPGIKDPALLSGFITKIRNNSI